MAVNLDMEILKRDLFVARYCLNVFDILQSGDLENQNIQDDIRDLLAEIDHIEELIAAKGIKL